MAFSDETIFVPGEFDALVRQIAAGGTVEEFFLVEFEHGVKEQRDLKAVVLFGNTVNNFYIYHLLLISSDN